MKRLRMVILWILGIIAVLLVWLFGYFAFSPRIGSDPAGERLKRIQASPNQKEGRFQNVVETNMDMPLTVMAKVMYEMVRGGDAREPKDTLPTVDMDIAS